ncbi:nucleotidyl transferase AbiEii/AbiGii toxin family protein [Candidatus Pacearchaeota archaeon]|nr:nucleotidyl transferase AbiEii/AbiGii toxin family protein [Candidatus Pacearchaeota archaeon]
MLHENKEEFLNILERASAQTGFPLRLLEKDYYLTLVLANSRELSDSLIFKGGTCLNKIYFSYYRLSEDLDFTLMLPKGEITRSIRRKQIQPIKNNLKSFVQKLGMSIADIDRAGRNESTQYIYYLQYPSIILDKNESIKVEVSLRFNPVRKTEEHIVHHKFVHPFTGKPLFDAGKVLCLSLKELVAEKLRAASGRRIIASRDFYDIGHLLKEGFDFMDSSFLKIFLVKAKEDNASTKLKDYQHNLGRTDEEIADMKFRLEDELLPVLSSEEKKAFDIDKILKQINRNFSKMK